MSWVIEAEELTKSYRMGQAEVLAVRGVDLQVAEGEFVALMGASGSGKTTLLHLLGCLDRPSGGAYRLQGRDVSRLSRDERAIVRNQSIGFVFQSFNLLPRFSALENVALPLLYRTDARDATRRAVQTLERVGLADRTVHRPTELSGGQQQRVAIARALVTDPPLILADEPTGNLDSATGEEIMALLAECSADGRTVMVVTHDARVAGYAQRVLRMRDGEIVAP